MRPVVSHWLSVHSCYKSVHLQRDLTAARAQIVRKDAEIEVLKEQNKEITDELSWVVKDLLRLKKADVDERCRTWLLSSQGLSTVLATKKDAEKENPFGVPIFSLISSTTNLMSVSCVCDHRSPVQHFQTAGNVMYKCQQKQP